MSKLNKQSAEVWNECVRLDRIYLSVANHRIHVYDFQRIFKSWRHMSSANKYHVIHTYCQNREDMWKSIRAKHNQSSKVRLPYKHKRYFTSGWNNQAVRRRKNHILLSKPMVFRDGKMRKQKPYKCYVKNPPENIAEVELVYRGNKYCLAIKYKIKEENVEIKSSISSAIDLGEIHTITAIDSNKNAVVISGRELRSIKHHRNKHLSVLRSKRGKCTKYSNRWWKYQKAIDNLSWKYEKKILNASHKITRLYANWCIMNDVSVIYYGDLDSCTRNSKGRVSRNVNHKLNYWNYGQIMRLLMNKLEKHGVEFTKESEAYTSQTCPNCGNRRKPKGRDYKCPKCEYTNHRDVVGAINFLNFNTESNVRYYDKLEYLRIDL